MALSSRAAGETKNPARDLVFLGFSSCSFLKPPVAVVVVAVAVVVVVAVVVAVVIAIVVRDVVVIVVVLVAVTSYLYN